MNAREDDWTWTWTELDGGLLVWVGVMFFFILVGWAIGRTRGRGDAGAALGLLGPVGWIIAALLPEEGRRCPECRGVVPQEARRCKHCGVECDTASGGHLLAPETDAVASPRRGRSR